VLSYLDFKRLGDDIHAHVCAAVRAVHVAVNHRLGYAPFAKHVCASTHLDWVLYLIQTN
jgi:hypothetical protein